MATGALDPADLEAYIRMVLLVLRDSAQGERLVESIVQLPGISDLMDGHEIRCQLCSPLPWPTASPPTLRP